MAFQYCRNCDNGMGTPTLREAVEGVRTCPSCHSQQDVAGNIGQSALIEAVEWLFELVRESGDTPPFA